MHEHEVAVLKALRNGKHLIVEQIVKESGIGADQALWAIESLASAGFVSVKKEANEYIKLTQEGKEYAKDGMPESRLLKKVADGKVSIGKLEGRELIGMQWAKKNDWIKIANGTISLTDSGRSNIDKETYEERILKHILKNGGKEKVSLIKGGDAIALLTKRRLVEIEKRDSILEVSITDSGSLELSNANSNEIGQLDRQMISNRSWQGRKFRAYDIKLPVKEQNVARQHPLRELIAEIKQVYTGLGFKEVSGPIIEPAFWVMDSLFIPQDHPARDAQDTFYLDNPELLDIKEKEAMKKVASMHKKGWHTKWSSKVASTTLLRTHTTSVSVRFLYNLKDYNKSDLPIKIFSVGRVFRNETPDYRHLADFYQMDGVMIGENLTMTNLFDTLTKIYDALGFKVRFAPTYFPFVEPGVEIQAYYEPRDEWLEMGGAGIIRREIISAAGKKLSVLAWGPGVERILLMRDKSIRNIGELYGGGIGWLRKR